jgi:hypothetical protein
MRAHAWNREQPGIYAAQIDSARSHNNRSPFFAAVSQPFYLGPTIERFGSRHELIAFDACHFDVRRDLRRSDRDQPDRGDAGVRVALSG